MTVSNVGGSISTVFTLEVEQGPVDCEADGDYPAVEDGDISSISCPEFFNGTMDRLCTHGVLGSPIDHCIALPPRIALPVTEYVFLRKSQISP